MFKSMFVYFGIVISIFLMFIVYGYQPAKPEEIKAVYQLAKTSNLIDAQEEVKIYLAKHPNPTKNEIYDLKISVEKIITTNLTKEVSGNTNVKKLDHSPIIDPRLIVGAIIIVLISFTMSFIRKHRVFD